MPKRNWPVVRSTPLGSTWLKAGGTPCAPTGAAETERTMAASSPTTSLEAPLIPHLRSRNCRGRHAHQNGASAARARSWRRRVGRAGDRHIGAIVGLVVRIAGVD